MSLHNESTSKKSIFKQNLYANIILWSWVLALTGLGVIFHDDTQKNKKQFEERQKLYRALRQKKTEQYQKNQSAIPKHIINHRTVSSARLECEKIKN